MPAKRILSAALALLLVAAIPARAATVPTITVVDSVRPGAGSFDAMDASTSVALGGYLYFAATDGTLGYELYKTNGQTTTLVKDINVGSPSASPDNFAVLGDYLYFSADNGINGVELWRTNGTTSGTTLVSNINVDSPTLIPTGSLMLNFFYTVQLRATARVGNTVTISADIFDGTYDPLAYATVNIVDSTTSTVLYTKTFGSYGDYNSPATYAETFSLDCDANATLTIATQEYSGAKIVIGQELVASGGTFYGQYPTATRTADVCGDGSSSPTELTALNGYLYFQANDGASGFELWRTNGTTTERVKDINATFGLDSSPSNFTALNGYLYFNADDGVHGRELWRTNGTSLGTTLVKNINETGTAGVNSSAPTEFTALNGYLYFNADDGVHGRELWRTDGTAGGTTLVKNINATGTGGVNDSYPSELTALGDYLYFSAIDGTIGDELWRTDGTAGGTTMVKNINETGTAGVNGSTPLTFTALGDYLYFQANDGTNPGLWRTDGTITESVPFPVAGQSIDCDCYDTNIVAVGGRLYTTVYSNAIGYEFAYLDEPTYVLPGTNRDGSLWTATLVILASLTAAASIGLRVRGAKRA